jgi:hypothetical protein
MRASYSSENAYRTTKRRMAAGWKEFKNIKAIE